MKSPQLLVVLVLVGFLGVMVTDFLYFSKFESRFKALEKERIVTSNQLATAKIISENLNHVRELVYQNMTFTTHKDSLGPDLAFFMNLSESLNDLKMKLVSMVPIPPTVAGRVTTYKYAIEVEGDFFSFGEFCSKLENNRRIMSLEGFELEPAGQTSGEAFSGPSRRPLRIKMQLNTYRVNK